MRLRVGDRVQIAPPSHVSSARASARVVGWVEGQSFILTTPQSTTGRLVLHQGEVVVVRVFTGRSAFAFRCSVLRNTSPVGDFLHLSFPQAIDGVDVRSSPLFRLGLPATVSTASTGEPVQATIDNMGSTGALLLCAAPLGATGDSVKVAFELVLHDVPVALVLNASIRTAEAAEGHHRHGVSFVDPTAHERLVLAAFVCFHTYENPALGV
jgi:hypothetical protein